MRLTRNRIQGSLFWQPNEFYKPEDHIKFEGDLLSYTYSAQPDHVEALASNLYHNVIMPTLKHGSFDVDIFNPPNKVKEIDVGNKGILVGVDLLGRTYHMEAQCESIIGNDFRYDNMWQNAYILNYSFRVFKVQIGNTELWVVRVDMGDGTYAQLLMTEKEKEMFDAEQYRERRLREDSKKTISYVGKRR